MWGNKKGTRSRTTRQWRQSVAANIGQLSDQAAILIDLATIISQAENFPECRARWCNANTRTKESQNIGLSRWKGGWQHESLVVWFAIVNRFPSTIRMQSLMTNGRCPGSLHGALGKFMPTEMRYGCSKREGVLEYMECKKRNMRFRLLPSLHVPMNDAQNDQPHAVNLNNLL
jgi:hypothetical protein